MMAYVHQTCRVPGINGESHVLGIDFGTDRAASLQFNDRTTDCIGLHRAISSIGDTGVELVLTRKCANVCKIVNLLRAVGPDLDDTCTKLFDDALDCITSRIVGGHLPETALNQAAFGTQSGGLGLRKASSLRLPAFIASRVASKALVFRLADSLNAIGLLPGNFVFEFASKLDDAIGAFKNDVGVDKESAVDALVLEEFDFTSKVTHAIFVGQDLPNRTTSKSVDHRALLLSPLGHDDPESSDGHGLQRKLCDMQDEIEFAKLQSSFSASERWDDYWRLEEFRQAPPVISSAWMWRLSLAQGEIVPPNEFAQGVRIRLGGECIDGSTACSRCGKQFDPQGYHPLRCALSEATRGHNRVRDEALHLVHLADSSSRCEVPGLVASRPSLRPADILSDTAVPGGRVALDIGVATPGSCAAGNNCCESMWSEKLKHYEHVLPEMRLDGLHYVPLVFSCFGRIHCEAKNMFRLISISAARKAGISNSSLLAHRTFENIGVALVRRYVAMYNTCLPPLSPETLNLMLGDGFGDD